MSLWHSQSLPFQNKQPSRRRQTGDKAKSVSVESAMMRKCRTLRGAKEWPDLVWGRQKLRGGSWHLQDEKGEPGKSGSRYQAEGTATAKTECASGNPKG